MSIYEDILDESEVELSDITKENIAVQHDKKFVKLLDSKMDELIMAFKLNGLPLGTNAAKHKDIVKVTKELSILLEQRFGLPINIMHSEMLGYVVPLSGTQNSALTIDRTQALNYYVDQIKSSCWFNKENCVDQRLDSSDDTTDKRVWSSNAIMHELLYSAKVMDELYKAGKISVDFKEAKIIGLLDETKKRKMTTIMGFNFGHLIEKGIAPREMTAIVLHEVGHQFTHISYSNIVSKTGLSAIQSLTDDKLSNRDKVVMTYQQLSGKKETNLTKITDSLPNLLVKTFILTKENNSAMFNSEVFADQFAARFGYGEEVVTALNKYYFVGDRESPLIMWGMVALAAIFIILVISSALNSRDVLYKLQGLYMAAALILGLLIPVIMQAVTRSGSMNIHDEHEFSYARTRRMKLELIRQLRTNKTLPKDDKEFYESILRLDSYLELTASEVGTLNRFYDWLSGNGTEVAWHEVYQRTEQIMENDIHARAFGLKNR